VVILGRGTESRPLEETWSDTITHMGPPKSHPSARIIRQTHASKEACSVLLLTPLLALSQKFSRHKHMIAKTNRVRLAPVTSREADLSVTMTSLITDDAKKVTAHPCMVHRSTTIQ
jgi:hypothetical protein